MSSSISLFDAHTFLYKCGENQVNKKCHTRTWDMKLKHEAAQKMGEPHFCYISRLNELSYRSCSTGLDSIVSCVRAKVQWAPCCYIRRDAKILTFLLTRRDSIILQPATERDTLEVLEAVQQLDTLLKHLEIYFLYRLFRANFFRTELLIS